jgi:hypothetical protein
VGFSPNTGAGYQADNCLLVEHGTAGVYIDQGNIACYNNTALFCNYGFSGNFVGVPGVGRFNNNVAIECSSLDFHGIGVTANALNCADTDGTLPVDATNLRNQDARTQLRIFYDLARAGNKAFTFDGRIHHDSVLVGMGLAIAGLTRDGDGRLRPDPPSIGAWEPYPTAYAPAAEIVAAVKRHRAGA